MRILSHTVIAAESGRTVKELLRGLWHISGSLLSRLKFRGAITVNGAPVTVNHLLHTGDILQADVSDQPGENPHILPVDYPLAILYEDRKALYSLEMLSEIDLAYAQTVHKAQGSEYRAVILSAFSGSQLLLTRSVLYTAITRARELFIIVGNEEVIAAMTRNDRQQRRYSGLKLRLEQGEPS